MSEFKLEGTKYYIEKDPNARLDYSVDWSKWLLAVSDTISSFSVTSPSAVVIDSITQVSGIVTAWVSGGDINSRVPVIFHIVTTAGRIDERTIWLKIQEQ